MVLTETQELQSYREKDDDPEKNYAEDSGCTANVLLITKTHIYCANAGDARSVLYQDSKTIIGLSNDHKPNDKVEKARIEAAGCT